MSVRLTKTYDVAMLHTYTIDVDEEDYLQYLFDNIPPDSVDYEEMFDYFESKGHNVEHEDEAVDYQNNGVEIEFI